MSATGLLLGVINVGIVVIILLLIGALADWVMRLLGVALDQIVRKLYIAFVALVALYLIARLLLGTPAVRLFGE